MPVLPTHHRTVTVRGHEIAYREAGPADAPYCFCCTVSPPARTCSATCSRGSPAPTA
ncbi:hypothetical protein STANM309S_00343 [Streptomyces tanashiensis]